MWEFCGHVSFKLIVYLFFAFFQISLCLISKACNLVSVDDMPLLKVTLTKVLSVGSWHRYFLLSVGQTTPFPSFAVQVSL